MTQPDTNTSPMTDPMRAAFEEWNIKDREFDNFYDALYEAWKAAVTSERNRIAAMLERQGITIDELRKTPNNE